ncbi:secreted protein of cryptosprodidium-specific SKSR protein family [Cryptosporidium felis]|nr:secreted protein of cryptosprodidium-specific SKSR protein family [Cryptosporidium felis]
MFQKKAYYLSLIFVLLVILFTELHGAQASGEDDTDSKDQNSAIKSDSDDTDSIEKLSYSDTCEINFAAEFLAFNIISLLYNILKFLAIYEPQVIECELMVLNAIYGSVSIQLEYDNKAELVPKQRLDHMKHVLVQNLELVSELNSFGGFSKAFFDTASKESAAIQELLLDLIQKTKDLLLLEPDSFLKTILMELTKLAGEWLVKFVIFSETYKNTPRKSAIRLILASKESVEKMSLKTNVRRSSESLISKSIEEKHKNGPLIDDYKNFLSTGNFASGSDNFSLAKELYNMYVRCDGLSEEEIFELETMILVAINIVGLVGYTIYSFDFQGFDNHSQKTCYFKEEIEGHMARRMTIFGISEGQYIQTRLSVIEKLDLKDLKSYHFVADSHSGQLEKSGIVVGLKWYYTFILKTLVKLKEEQKRLENCSYLKNLFSMVINFYNTFSRELLNVVKLNDSDKKRDFHVKKAQKFSIDKRIMIEQEKKKQIDESKKELIEEKKKLREEKKRIEQLEEEEKLLRKILLENQQKRKKIEKEFRQKNKGKRDFPVIESSNEESTKLGTEKTRSRSRSGSPKRSMESSVKSGSMPPKSKQDRKREKLEKILQQEAKSELKAQIKEVITQQRCSNISERKKKQQERKTRRMNLKEKEELDRLEEKEKEKRLKKEHQDKINYNNYYYTLVNSIESIEGLFMESAKQVEKNLESLITAVFGIISSELQEKEQISEVTEGLSGLSISEVLMEEGAAPSGVPSAPHVGRRRADEVPISGGSSVPTAQLFGSGAVFSMRGRSRSKSRAASRSRSRSRSGSTSRSTPSRSRKTSRSRSESTSKGRSKSRSRSEERSPQQTSKSKFTKFFSSSEEPQQSPQNQFPGLKFFNVIERDYSNITESSRKQDIVTAIDECASEIIRIHSEISLLLSGEEFLAAKLVEKSLIRDLIRLLLILNEKKSQ